MTSGTMRGVRSSLWLLAAGTLSGAGADAAFAQSPAYPAGAVVQALPTGDGGAELRRHLTDLASNPRSLASLLGAGRAALGIGDPQAALGFLARAEEIAPRDARVKAAMAAAFVQLEQPQAALRFFSEAQSLGAPEIEIAGDRGLAYDMTGNPRRAQQDYAMVLQQRGDDAEIRRRMALSLAISGNREAALRMLDPLVQRRDRPSFRTRAFILALTGDAAGASQAVQSAMPGQAGDMAPFLARLAALNPAQKAMAVHFGRFPADGRAVRMAEAVDTSAHPAAVAMTGGGRPDASQPSFGRAVQRQQQRARTAAASPSRPQPARALPQRPAQAPTPTLEPRRRRGAEEPTRPSRVRAGSRERGYNPLDVARGEPIRTTAAPARQQRPAAQQPAPAASAPAQTVAQAQSRVPGPVQTVQTSAPPPAATVPQPGFSTAAPLSAARAQQQPIRVAEVLPVDLPPSTIAEPAPAAETPAAVPPPAAPAPAAIAPASTGLADIAALVQSLPPEVERTAPARTAPAATPRPAAPRPAAAQPARTAAAAPARTASAAPARTTAAQRRARAQPAQPAHPSRHWVQIAGGNRAAFNHQLGRLRASAPELLRSRPAYWAVNGNSNRLLVGPFATPAEARAFVNQLARKDVASFPWTSQAGEEVERLPAR